MLENFTSVERQLSDEAERLKTEVERDAVELRQSLTIGKARQAKHIDTASDTLRQHIVRLQTTLTRCQVHQRPSSVSAESALGMCVCLCGRRKGKMKRGKRCRESA